nr:nucleoporin [Candidatus Anammoximicrobium sp.]
MTTSAASPQILTLPELESILTRASSAVLLVSPRLLRRVIRLDRRIGTLGVNVPHGSTYLLPQDRLFDCVSRFELDLDSSRRLPEVVLLIERPEEEEFEKRPAQEILREYWRLLFHIRVHQELDQRIADGQLTEDAILDRLRHLGSTEYAEIRAVLQRDEMLLPPRTDVGTYVEFAAVFLELLYFAPEQLPWYFPALLQCDRVADLLATDVDHRALYEATRLPGAGERVVRDLDGAGNIDFTEPSEGEAEDADPLRPSPPAYWRLIARAEKASSVGNAAKAAILRLKASRLALPDRSQEALTLATAEVERLARRLQPALGLREEEVGDWAEALSPLLVHADQGFRTAESRVLHDLQKVCLEHERGLYKLRFFRWCWSRGRQPLRQPLPLLSAVMAVKHLRSAASKLTVSRLAGDARARLSRLIEAAVGQAQRRLRDRIRPLIAEALTVEGLQPRNVPEQVAFHKIVEELLDRMVRQGYLSLGHLRDALSQNNLKLSDLTSPWELVTGDLLLRVDRHLATDLPGVYYRGPVYLRWSQQLSALAFGTGFGRLLTRYLALPYGGAFLLVEFGRHVAHTFHHASGGSRLQAVGQVAADPPVAPKVAPGPDWLSLVLVLLFGTFLLLLIDREGFRRACLSGLRKLGQACRWLLYGLPVSMWQLPWVRKFFDSVFYAVLIGYGLKPLIFTACIVLPFRLFRGELTWATWVITFLAINLALNSPLGRYLDQLITEQLMRGWRELQIRVFAAAFHWIMDSFHFLLNGLERVLYTVDEWLRFRTGDNRLSVLVKVVGGGIWFFVSYVTAFVFTLLLEPQINPIKHFPVVTVSHKLLLPTGPMIVAQLSPYLGLARANTLVWSTIWLIPGVFGFLVWELKENWRLYASNRPRRLKPVPIGRHGETMLRLLRVGIHSGTLPKLYTKLRQAARKATQTGKWRVVHKHLERLRGVKESVQNFLDRELVTLLAESPAWRGPRLMVERMQLASNQIQAEIGHPDFPRQPLRLAFQERAGWIIVSLPQRGWLDALPADQRAVCLRAVQGLYHLAGGDFIWEHLVSQFKPAGTWYDVNAEGLLVWRDGQHSAAELYKLRDSMATNLWATPPYRVIEVPPPHLDEIFLSRSRPTWAAWVAMWDAGTESAFGAGLPTSPTAAFGAGLPTSPKPPTAGLPTSPIDAFGAGLPTSPKPPTAGLPTSPKPPTAGLPTSP